MPDTIDTLRVQTEKELKEMLHYSSDEETRKKNERKNKKILRQKVPSRKKAQDYFGAENMYAFEEP